MSVCPIRPGPDSARVVRVLRAEMAGGTFPVGQYMPSVRDLAMAHRVSRSTTQRALKILEADGLLVAEPRHGFQVVRLPDSGAKQPMLLAYVIDVKPGENNGFDSRILSVFLQVACRRGFGLLTVGVAENTTADIVQQIRQSGAAGVILHSDRVELAEAIGQLALPVVSAEFWGMVNRRFDSISQDNFGGAMQAAEHLVSLGHRRIAWIGPAARTITSDERWGGAVAGLQRHGLGLAASVFVDGDNLDAVRGLLCRPDRPTGFLCLWTGFAMGLARIAAQQGLRMGQDFDLVGWTTDEQYDEYRLVYPNGSAPDTVIWSMERLAENVVSRLAERRGNPNLPIVHNSIATRLRINPRTEHHGSHAQEKRK